MSMSMSWTSSRVTDRSRTINSHGLEGQQRSQQIRFFSFVNSMQYRHQISAHELLDAMVYVDANARSVLGIHSL